MDLSMLRIVVLGAEQRQHAATCYVWHGRGTAEDVDHVPHAGMRAHCLDHRHQRPRGIRHVPVCSGVQNHMLDVWRLPEHRNAASWLCGGMSVTVCMLWRHTSCWSDRGAGDRTLKALAGVALADVAGAGAAGLMEALLPEVGQQQNAAALHLLLTERHLQMGRQSERQSSPQILAGLSATEQQRHSTGSLQSATCTWVGNYVVKSM